MRQNLITGVGKIKIVPIGWSGSGFISWAVKQDGPFEHGRPVIIQHLAEVRDRLIGIKVFPNTGQKPYLPQIVLTPDSEPVIADRKDCDPGIHNKSRML